MNKIIDNIRRKVNEIVGEPRAEESEEQNVFVRAFWGSLELWQGAIIAALWVQIFGFEGLLVAVALIYLAKVLNLL